MDPEPPIAKIDEGIAIVENAPPQVPRSCPEYVTGVLGLAMARYARYTVLKQKENLDKSILHHTEAILLPHDSLTESDIVQLLFQLVCILRLHPKKPERPDDITYSQGVPYYERSVRALRDAVRKLRRNEGSTQERWVNFVHYGA